VGEVDPFDRGVVGRQRHRHAGGAVVHERMRGAEDPEDLSVAGERNLDEDMAASHLGEQLAGIGLAHDIDAVPDALGARDLDGLADVGL
jgi:hypothetical protein